MTSERQRDVAEWVLVFDRALREGEDHDAVLQDMVRAARRALTSAPDGGVQPTKVRCSRCDNPATCFGAYEGGAVPSLACSECCGHGNEDGWCVTLDDDGYADLARRLAARAEGESEPDAWQVEGRDAKGRWTPIGDPRSRRDGAEALLDRVPSAERIVPLYRRPSDPEPGEGEGEPHESHRWCGGGEYGSSTHGLMCGDCGVDIEDDAAMEPCPAVIDRPPESASDHPGIADVAAVDDAVRAMEEESKPRGFGTEDHCRCDDDPATCPVHPPDAEFADAEAYALKAPRGNDVGYVYPATDDPPGDGEVDTQSPISGPMPPEKRRALSRQALDALAKRDGEDIEEWADGLAASAIGDGEVGEYERLKLAYVEATLVSATSEYNGVGARYHEREMEAASEAASEAERALDAHVATLRARLRQAENTAATERTFRHYWARQEKARVRQRDTLRARLERVKKDRDEWKKSCKWWIYHIRLPIRHGVTTVWHAKRVVDQAHELDTARRRLTEAGEREREHAEWCKHRPCTCDATPTPLVDSVAKAMSIEYLVGSGRPQTVETHWHEQDEDVRAMWRRRAREVIGATDRPPEGEESVDHAGRSQSRLLDAERVLLSYVATLRARLEQAEKRAGKWMATASRASELARRLDIAEGDAKNMTERYEAARRRLTEAGERERKLWRALAAHHGPDSFDDECETCVANGVPELSKTAGRRLAEADGEDQSTDQPTTG